MQWRLKDIIDLEYFLYQDNELLSAGKQENLHERDRDIYLTSVMPGVKEDQTPDRRSIIHIWLNRRREEEKSKSSVLPGELFESIFSSLRFVFVIVGFIMGAGLTTTFLSYTGDSPVNVFVYFSVFVLSQLILLLLLFVLSISRLYKRSLTTSSVLYVIISRLMRRMIISAKNHVGKKLSADQRLQAESAMGAVISKSRTYGVLFFLPSFILAQLSGIGFNLGLLGATFFKVATSDIAFGWQSTIQMSASAVHGLVQKIALPWSWIATGDMAYPALTQIEGSRIILKEGIYHLSTPDLVSWWPFLCFSVFFYGLLPRLLLFAAALFARRRYMAALDFRQGACEQLVQRMTTPQLTTHGSRVDDAEPTDEESAANRPVHQHAPDEARTIGKNLLVLIPDELYDSCSPGEIESVVSKGTVSKIQEVIRNNKDYASDRELLENLSKREPQNDSDILLIQEAWQPPIMEYIDFIRQLRKAIGQGPCIKVGLIGKPKPDTIFTPVQAENLQIWTRKITAIGDPCIYTEGLVINAS